MFGILLTQTPIGSEIVSATRDWATFSAALQKIAPSRGGVLQRIEKTSVPEVFLYTQTPIGSEIVSAMRDCATFSAAL
jgi:hypothetical protein